MATVPVAYVQAEDDDDQPGAIRSLERRGTFEEAAISTRTLGFTMEKSASRPRPPIAPPPVSLRMTRSIKPSQLSATLSNTSFLEDLKAARMERRPYAEVLAQLSPRSRRKKRLETRCEINKRVWGKMAVRVQALIRGVAIRRKYDIQKLVHQRSMDRLVEEKVQVVRNMMRESHNHNAFEVLQAVDEILSIHPTSAEVLSVKALVQLHRGYLDGALETTMALLTNPGASDIHTEARRVRLCVFMRQKKLSEALHEIEMILEREGQVPVYAHLRALLLGVQGRFALALQQIDVAIDRQGGNSESLLRRGMLRGCLQDWERAMVDLKHSLAYRDTARGRHFLGRTFLCMRRWKDAAREVKKALKLQPEHELAQRALAEIRIPYDPTPGDRNRIEAADAADDPHNITRLASAGPPPDEEESVEPQQPVSEETGEKKDEGSPQQTEKGGEEAEGQGAEDHGDQLEQGLEAESS